MQFKEHVFSEEGDKFCNMCEYTTQNGQELATHYRDMHDVALSPDGADGASSCGDEEPGLDQPKVTSSGKVKQFRCKQCSHTSVTKREFWEHTRGHIKAERLLTCPKCPFVTEYKHHFEYHLRNHFGSKPFKCDQCSYSCVNKSMLNSHLKSHSNVYQFRCADCAYATKYCHSLKLHLRKYSHKPAMVLNSDGSPNPLPIVDVYGTRRGPKTRPRKSEDVNGKSLSPQLPTALSPLYSVPQSFGVLPPPIQFPYGFQFSSPIQNSVYSSSPPTSETTEQLAVEEFNKLKQLYQINNNTQDYRSSEEEVMVPSNYLTSTPLDLSKSEISSQIAERGSSGSAKNRRKGVAIKRVCTTVQESFNEDNSHCEAKSFKPTLSIPSSQLLCSPELLSPSKLLCSPELLSPIKSESDSKSRADPSSLSNTDESLSTDSADISGTDRKSMPDQVSEVDGHRTPEPVRASQTSEGSTKIKKEENNNEEIARESSKATTPDTSCSNSTDENENHFRCSFCDIIFKNLAMYSIHMGFHDYRDPFTCNMCGHKTKDEMAFFLHIARFPHS